MDTLVKAMPTEDPLLVVSLIRTETVEEARQIHDTLPTATAALGRVINAALLLASTLKDNQKVTLQVKGDGPIREIIAEADYIYRVRAYIKRPHIHLGLKDDHLDVGRAIGKGFINVIRDLGLREIYQSSVPLMRRIPAPRYRMLSTFSYLKFRACLKNVTIRTIIITFASFSFN